MGKYQAAEKTNKIKTVTERGTSSTGVSPPVLCDPHIHEVVQADFGAAFLEALPLCHFDLQSPGTTPRSENETGSTEHISKLKINSIISPVQILEIPI